MARITVQLLNEHERRRGQRRRSLYRADVLDGQRYWRTAARTVGHGAQQYQAHRQISRKPTLRQHRMVELAIGCDLQMRAALQAWRAAA